MYTSSICEDPVTAVNRSATCGCLSGEQPVDDALDRRRGEHRVDGAQVPLSATGPIGTATGPSSGSL